MHSHNREADHFQIQISEFGTVLTPKLREEKMEWKKGKARKIPDEFTMFCFCCASSSSHKTDQAVAFIAENSQIWPNHQQKRKHRYSQVLGHSRDVVIYHSMHM